MSSATSKKCNKSRNTSKTGVTLTRATVNSEYQTSHANHTVASDSTIPADQIHTQSLAQINNRCTVIDRRDQTRRCCNLKGCVPKQAPAMPRSLPLRGNDWKRVSGKFVKRSIEDRQDLQKSRGSSRLLVKTGADHRG